MDLLKLYLTKLILIKYLHPDFNTIKTKFFEYLENYSFEKEIVTMAPLYSNDVSRIKNMRLKILEALKNKNMIDNVKDLLD